MILRLLLGLLLAPLAELVVLLWIADRFSWETAVAIILAGMVAGALLIRRAGMRTIRLIRGRARPAEGVESLANHLFTLAAGVLFLVPGVLSDLVAVALLVPWSRRQIQSRMLAGLRARFYAHPGEEPPAAGRIIDVQVVKPEEKRNGRITKPE